VLDEDLVKFLPSLVVFDSLNHGKNHRLKVSLDEGLEAGGGHLGVDGGQLADRGGE